MRLGLAPFLLFSTLGALLWIAVPVVLGAVFRAEVEWVLGRLTELGSGALLTLGVVLVLYAAIKATQRHLFLRMLRAARMTVQELRELLQSALPPVVIDVRSHAVRKLDPRRIPGAIAVNMEDAAAALQEIPPDRDVVVYCS
jgi:hypothetical protein